MLRRRDRAACHAWTFLALLALALFASAGCSLGFDDEYPLYEGETPPDDGGPRTPDAAPDASGPEAGPDPDATRPEPDAGPGEGGTPDDAGCGDGSVADVDACVSDPCATAPCGANASCAPAAAAPGYTCTCDAGYELDDDACVDIDECFEGTYLCHPTATCSNTAGGYDCTCPLGYAGGGRDGVACTPRITAGNGYGCAVMMNGRVQCWGSNTDGALGDGTETDRPAPVMVVALEDVVGLTSYNTKNCAIVESGELRCWGNGQLQVQTVADLDGVIAASTTFGHTCAVQRGGTVRCWGRNDQGQIGNGEMSPAAIAVPTEVAELKAPATFVHVIDNTSCAVLQLGDVQCWGTGFLGTDVTMSSPVPVDAETGNVLALASGGYHWCALLGSRQLDCWGNHALFGGTSGTVLEPQFMSGVADAIAVHVQVYRTHALLVDKTIRWWDAGTAVATVPGISNAVAIAVGTRLACALHEDGTVSCWNWVNSGDVPVPAAVAGLDLW
jgi:hypothetical protein